MHCNTSPVSLQQYESRHPVADAPGEEPNERLTQPPARRHTDDEHGHDHEAKPQQDPVLQFDDEAVRLPGRDRRRRARRRS